MTPELSRARAIIGAMLEEHGEAVTIYRRCAALSPSTIMRGDQFLRDTAKIPSATTGHDGVCEHTGAARLLAEGHE